MYQTIQEMLLRAREVNMFLWREIRLQDSDLKYMKRKRETSRAARDTDSPPT
jgi:hypothetical protein